MDEPELILLVEAANALGLSNEQTFRKLLEKNCPFFWQPFYGERRRLTREEVGDLGIVTFNRESLRANIVKAKSTFNVEAITLECCFVEMASIESCKDQQTRARLEALQKEENRLSNEAERISKLVIGAKDITALFNKYVKRDKDYGERQVIQILRDKDVLQPPGERGKAPTPEADEKAIIECAIAHK